MAVFLSSFITFVIATMPLTFVVNNIQLPKNINIGSVSGSIWEGEIDKIILNNNSLQSVKTELIFWSLFLFSPKLQLMFGDTMLAGPEGKLTITISSEQVELNDVELLVSANDIAKQLPLPIPVTAKGNVELSFSELVLTTTGKLSCKKAQGKVTWLRSGVIALNEEINLGKFKADVHCEKGDIRVKILPENNLGLSFDALLSLTKQKISGQGYVKPGAKFPAQLKSALSFLGNADNQGRYTVKL